MNHHLPLKNKLIIMGSVMASLFLVALDQTIISTALGKIVEDFRSFDSLGWIVTAYMLTTTVTVPIAGKLSDLFGRRLLLLIGVVVFGLGSLLSGMSGSVEMLIWSRALQGIGGGIITANAFTIVGDLFSAKERGKWQGLIGAVFGISSLVGPLLGGFLTDSHTILGLTTDWRWTFYINVPVAIAAFGIIAAFCPPLRHDTHKPRIDYMGAALLATALSTLILAVDNTEQIFGDFLTWSGWSLGLLQVVLLSISAIATLGFIAVERRAKEPILPMEFFRHKNYVLAIGISLLFGGAFLGMILYLTQFNQQVFGASPTESGLMILPLVLGLMVSSIGSGQLIARTGRYKKLAFSGVVTGTIAVCFLSTLTPESSYTYEAVLMVFLGLGFGVMMPVINLIVQNEFSLKQLGAATSSSQLFRGLGSTIGVAVFGALLTGGMAAQLTDLDSPYLTTLKQSPVVEQVGDLSDPNTLVVLNSEATKQKNQEYVEAIANSQPDEAQESMQQEFKASEREFSRTITYAFADSLRVIFWIASGMMLLVCVLVFMIDEVPLRSEKQAVTT